MESSSKPRFEKMPAEMDQKTQEDNKDESPVLVEDFCLIQKKVEKDDNDNDNDEEGMKQEEEEEEEEQEEEQEEETWQTILQDDKEGWDVECIAEMEQRVTQSKKWSPLLQRYQQKCRNEIMICSKLFQQNRASFQRRNNTTYDPVLADVVTILPEALQKAIVSWMIFPEPCTIVPGIYANKCSNTIIISPSRTYVRSKRWDDYWLDGKIMDCIMERRKYWIHDLQDMILANGYQCPYNSSNNNSNTAGENKGPENARCEGNFIEWFGNCDDPHDDGRETHFIARAVQAQKGLYHGISEWALDATCTVKQELGEEDTASSPFTSRYYMVKKF